MKLLLLSDAAAPHTRKWANWFAANGHEVHVVVFNNQLDPGYSGVLCHFAWESTRPTGLLNRSIRSIRLLLRLRRLVREINGFFLRKASFNIYLKNAVT